VIKLRKMRLAGRVARKREGRGETQTEFLVEQTEGKRPFGRPRCKWVYNIKMDLQKVRWGSMDWIYLAQD